jgi:hypothetical protein
VNFVEDVSFTDHARVAKSEVDLSMFVKHEDIAAQIEVAVDRSLAVLAAANSAANASSPPLMPKQSHPANGKSSPMADAKQQALMPWNLRSP